MVRARMPWTEAIASSAALAIGGTSSLSALCGDAWKRPNVKAANRSPTPLKYSWISGNSMNQGVSSPASPLVLILLDPTSTMLDTDVPSGRVELEVAPIRLRSASGSSTDVIRTWEAPWSCKERSTESKDGRSVMSCPARALEMENKRDASNQSEPISKGRRRVPVTHCASNWLGVMMVVRGRILLYTGRTSGFTYMPLPISPITGSQR